MSIFDNTTTNTGAPWGPLEPGVMQGVDYIRQLLTTGPYAGPYTAPIDPNQIAGINAGAGAANTAMGAGASLLPGLTSSFNYYNNALTPGQSNNPWLTNQDAYLGLAGNVANNPYMDSMITSALRDPYRQLTEQTLPGIRSSANLAGHAGGSQEAVMAGIANRGFMDRASDVAAQMRGGAYSQGLDIANQAATGDNLLAQNAANNLYNMGLTGVNLGTSGARDLYNTGAQMQGLNNEQISGQIAQHMAPWELAQSFGSYMNPLAGALKTQTTDQNMLGAYLFQALGPILGGIGSGVGQDAWDWIKGIFGNMTGQNPPTCYVAREVFGARNPEWVLFFLWKETRAPRWFSRLYDRHSRSVAQWLKGKDKIKSALRSLMRKAYRTLL